MNVAILHQEISKILGSVYKLQSVLLPSLLANLKNRIILMKKKFFKKMNVIKMLYRK